jgi:hypothetical protein
VRKNRTKRSRVTRSRTPAPGRKQGLALIKKTISELGLDIATFARNAKKWWWENHGRFIKAGHVKEVIHAFLRDTLKPPTWLTRYIERGLTA